MPFPEFERDRPSILFFCRGRGRGHAVPDAVIARELAVLRPDVQLHFVSYGTGARTLEALGFSLIDLDLPDNNSIAVTTVLAGRLIAALQPDLVVAHEEFPALPAAKILEKRTVMITDYFAAPAAYAMESLWFADHVLFLDRRGVHAEPPSARGKTSYLGPVMRPLEYRRRDRARAREELGLSPLAQVISVMPGSWTEALAPLAQRMFAAFGALPGEKHLVWMAGEDEQMLRRAATPGVTVKKADWQIDRLMAASDLVITKCNRMTVRELAALGIRTLSVSYGLNPPDEQSIRRLASNRTIQPRELTARLLALTLRAPEPAPVRFRTRSCAKELAAMVSAGSSWPAAST